MARTIRCGKHIRNNARGYRLKVAVRRGRSTGGDIVKTDWNDCWTTLREINRVRRAADREATRLALVEYRNDIEDILREWEIEEELEKEYLGLSWDDEELY